MWVSTANGLEMLKLTPLRYANIPPPLSLHELQLAHEAQDVCINSALGTVAVLTMENVEVFSQNTRRKRATHVLQRMISLSSIGGEPLQVATTDDGRVFLLEHGRDNLSHVHVARWTEDSSPDLAWEVCVTNGHPISSIYCGLTGLVCAEGPNGEIYDLASSNRLLPSAKLPDHCPWVELVRVGSKVCNRRLWLLTNS